MMKLIENYQAVIDHVAVDIAQLKKSGKDNDRVALKMLEKRRLWLHQRKKSLYESQDKALIDLKNNLETYLSQCTTFWKETSRHISEDRLSILWELTKEVTMIYSLSGYDAYFSVFTMLKRLRYILPPEHYKAYTPAGETLQKIKETCLMQIKMYIKRP